MWTFLNVPSISWSVAPSQTGPAVSLIYRIKNFFLFWTAYVDNCMKINSCPEDDVFKLVNTINWGRNWKFLSQVFTIWLGISKSHRVWSDFSFHWVWFEIMKMPYLFEIFPFKFSPISYLGIHPRMPLWQHWHLFFCTSAVSRIALLWTLSFLRKKSLFFANYYVLVLEKTLNISFSK